MAGVMTVVIVDGPSATISWQSGMTAMTALELAYKALLPTPVPFDYTLQYFGQYGYMVSMINQVYGNPTSAAAPGYWWQMYVNGKSQTNSVDQVTIPAGAVLSFSFELTEVSKASKDKEERPLSS